MLERMGCAVDVGRTTCHIYLCDRHCSSFKGRGPVCQRQVGIAVRMGNDAAIKHIGTPTPAAKFAFASGRKHDTAANNTIMSQLPQRLILPVIDACRS